MNKTAYSNALLNEVVLISLQLIFKKCGPCLVLLVHIVHPCVISSCLWLQRSNCFELGLGLYVSLNIFAILSFGHRSLQSVDTKEGRTGANEDQTFKFGST
jgi:hypothetical protein